MRCLKRAYKNWVLIATARFNFYSRLVLSNNYISFEVLRKAVVTYYNKTTTWSIWAIFARKRFYTSFPELSTVCVLLFFFPECWLLTCIKARIYVRHCARCRAKWLNFLCNIACNDVNWTWILQPIKLHLEESRTSHVFMSSFMSRKVFCGTKNSCGCSLEERIPLLTSAKVSIAVSSNCVWFLDIIFSVVIVAFVVVVLILNTRGGAHVARIVHYFFLPPFDSKIPFSFHLLCIADYLTLFRGDKSDAKLLREKLQPVACTPNKTCCT